MKNRKKFTKTIGISIIAAAAIITLLVTITGTRDAIIGVFGWAVFAYIPALLLLGILVLVGRRLKVSRLRVLVYAAAFLSIVSTLHILLSKSLIDSDSNYILAPLDGYVSVGGTLISILSSPIVLVFRDYGVALTLSFILTAVLIFAAIFPYIYKIKDKKPKQKPTKLAKPSKSPKPSAVATVSTNPLPKESDLYVSQISEEPQAASMDAASKIFQPRTPYEPKDNTSLLTVLLDEEQQHRRRAEDSSIILFGKDELPKEQKPNLKVLGGQNYFSTEAAKIANEKMSQTFGEYDPKQDYKSRYGGEQTGRSLNGYPQEQIGSKETLSPILTTTPPPEPKPKRVIANPKEYINTPIKPEEYLQMMPENTQGYSIPAGAPQSASNPTYPNYTPPIYPEPPTYPQQQGAAQSGDGYNFFSNTSPTQGAANPINSYPTEPVQPISSAPIHNIAAEVAPTQPIPPTQSQQILPHTKFNPSQVVAAPIQTELPVSNAPYGQIANPSGYGQAPSTNAQPTQPSGFGVKQEIVQPQQPKSVQHSVFDATNAAKAYTKPKVYIVPPLDLLRQYSANGSDFPEDFNIYKTKIEQTMEEFNIPAVVTDARRGPTFTRYELKLGPGYNIKKIANLQENLTMRLEVQSIRILAPIVGKNAFGIEIPNKLRDVVGLRSILASQQFMTADKGIRVALGKTLEGEPYVADLAAMPHLLVAGATGTGKSVFINQLIMSIIYKYSPEDVRLILIDPKKVELSVYQNLPNLLIKETVKEASHATNLLNWLTKEMDDRYNFLAKYGAVDIDNYNNEIRDRNTEPKMFRIVLIVDEMADLMMKGRGQVEEPIVRIAQLGRACGIHLILATQRPTVNVITGLIKGNILARVAFAVKTAMDSRIILDETGAESLLGKGDLIYSFKEVSLRMQGSLVETEDIRKVCSYIKSNNEASFDEQLADQIKAEQQSALDYTDDKQQQALPSSDKEQDFEQLLRRILRTFILEKKASVSMAQTKHSVGYIRAKKLLDAMTDRGFISAEDGSKPRDVLITLDEYDELFGDERA